MNDSVNHHYDLEERTAHFAKDVQLFLKTIPTTLANVEYYKQLILSSGSVAANYIEANESLGKKDFFMHIKIVKKEAKESRLWLRLLETSSITSLEKKRNLLVHESHELTLIFASISSKQNQKSPSE